MRIGQDRLARGLFDEVALHIGVAVANLVCAYDPGLVVLQGGMFAAVLDRIQAVIANAVPWETRIAVSDIGADAVLLGTVAAARAQAYERISRLLDESSNAAELAVVHS